MRSSGSTWRRIPNGDLAESSRVDHGFVQLLLKKKKPVFSKSPVNVLSYFHNLKNKKEREKFHIKDKEIKKKKL